MAPKGAYKCKSHHAIFTLWFVLAIKQGAKPRLASGMRLFKSLTVALLTHIVFAYSNVL